MMEVSNVTDNPKDYTDYFLDGDYINIRVTSYFQIYSFLQILSITCYSITIFLGLAGNGLVIWISGFKMKTVSAVWFLNLAIVDFISCIFLIFRIMQRILEFHSIFYFHLCNISLSALFTNLVTSVHFLILISLDRCLSVMWPLRAKIHRTKRLAWIISGSMWLLNILVFLVQLFFAFEFINITECSLIYYTPHRIRYRTTENSALIVQNVCIFAIPFLTIFVSYGLIILKLRTLRRRRHSYRPYLIIAAILLSFFVCWFPYHAWTLVALQYQNWKVDLIMTEVFTILAFFNCAVNPIIYVFLSRGFNKNAVVSIPKKVEAILGDPGDYHERKDENIVDYRTNALETYV